MAILLPKCHHAYLFLNVVITYGDIIKLFEQSEQAKPGDKDHLCCVFKHMYPNIYISCPRRFYDTVLRIVASTRSSIRGGRRLNRSQLVSYCKKTWTPRIRGQSHQGDYSYSMSKIKQCTLQICILCSIIISYKICIM